MPLTDAQFKKQVAPVKGLVPFFKLRWRFDFKDGRVKYGRWNQTGQDPQTMAAFVKKEGLLRASIEGERWAQGYSIHTLFECDGHQYAQCECINAVTAPSMFPKDFEGTGYKPTVYFVGMSILTNDIKHTVYIDGSWSQRPLTPGDKNFKLLEHTAGT